MSVNPGLSTDLLLLRNEDIVWKTGNKHGRIKVQSEFLKHIMKIMKRKINPDNIRMTRYILDRRNK